MARQTVLVTGATGYVGGRLVPRLLKLGYRVRAAGRSPAKLALWPWSADPMVETVAADVGDPASLRRACAGCSAAHYLVHSMDPGRADFAAADRAGATNMARAAEAEGVGRIVYLGGLETSGGPTSEHLESRDEVGRILASGKVPVTWLRAAMILGAGSGSFEILRYLVDRLPVMVTPRWVDTESQPIAIRNVLDYLAGCLAVPETSGQVFDIGGPETVTYRRLMEIYAGEVSLPRRRILPVPVLTPRLSSYWIDLVTPAPASLARPLAEGLGARLVCGDDRIRGLIPADLLDCRAAIRAAVRSGGRLAFLEREAARDAAPGAEEGILPGDPPWAGGTVYTDHRRIVLRASAEEAWETVARTGGGAGWRVAASEPPSRLRLVADEKRPGCAVLEFRVRPAGPGLTEVSRISRFVPRGLGGILYWRAVSPLKGVAATATLRGIARRTGRQIVSGPERVRAGSGPPGPRAGKVAA